MAVFTNSRLAHCKVYEDSKNNYLSFDRPMLKQRDTDLLYVFKEGDRLDKISARVYGNPQLKHIILRANPNVQHDLDIVVGQELVLPNPNRGDLL